MDDRKETLAPEDLLELLRQQRDLYRCLQDLSHRQRTLISGDRPELLLNILRDRQALVSALAKVNQQLSPYRHDWEAIYAALPEESRQAAAKLLEEVNEVLKTILQSDREDQALLAARKQAVTQSLNEVSDGRVVNAAYGQQGRNGAESGTADVTG